MLKNIANSCNMVSLFTKDNEKLIVNMDYAEELEELLNSLLPHHDRIFSPHPHSVKIIA